MKTMILFAALLAGGAAAAQIGNGQTPAAPPTPAATPTTAMSPAPGAGGVMQVCRADFEKLCPGMHPGDGKFGACVRSHIAEVSPACGAAMREMRAQRQRQ